MGLRAFSLLPKTSSTRGSDLDREVWVIHKSSNSSTCMQIVTQATTNYFSRDIKVLKNKTKRNETMIICFQNTASHNMNRSAVVYGFITFTWNVFLRLWVEVPCPSHSWVPRAKNISSHLRALAEGRGNCESSLSRRREPLYLWVPQGNGVIL